MLYYLYFLFIRKWLVILCIITLPFEILAQTESVPADTLQNQSLQSEEGTDYLIAGMSFAMGATTTNRLTPIYSTAFKHQFSSKLSIEVSASMVQIQGRNEGVTTPLSTPQYFRWARTIIPLDLTLGYIFTDNEKQRFEIGVGPSIQYRYSYQGWYRSIAPNSAERILTVLEDAGSLALGVNMKIDYSFPLNKTVKLNQIGSPELGVRLQGNIFGQPVIGNFAQTPSLVPAFDFSAVSGWWLSLGLFLRISV